MCERACVYVQGAGIENCNFPQLPQFLRNFHAIFSLSPDFPHESAKGKMSSGFQVLFLLFCFKFAKIRQIFDFFKKGFSPQFLLGIDFGLRKIRTRHMSANFFCHFWIPAKQCQESTCFENYKNHAFVVFSGEKINNRPSACVRVCVSCVGGWVRDRQTLCSFS